MRIGIEAERANHPAKTGVEHYAKQLILHLAKIDSRNRYTLYLRSQPQDWFLKLPENFGVKVMPFPKFWTQIRLSWEMLWHAPDVLFVPASSLPLIHPRHSVVTLHDTNFMYYPETDTAFMRQYLLWSYRYLAKAAWRVIAVSQSTKRDVMKFFDVPEARIKVVYHGYEQVNGGGNLSPEVSAKLPDKYVLFLSTIQPRKNLLLLIDAFVELKRQHPDLPHKLVVAGKPGWKFEPSLEKMKQNSDNVIYLGHVSDSDRWPLYSHADLFIIPSLYEGFGMGFLEAFQCGVPVAVSNISSLPEVGGDAALYFDPHSKEEIKSTILKVISNDALRQDLIARGKERLKDFSWEKCARQTLEVLTNV